MHYLGIDWADHKHDVCLMAADGQVLSQFTILHNWTGFQLLTQALSQLDDVRINIERPDGLLVDWLVTQGYTLFVTAPMVVAHRRPRRSKDDRGDAYLLAHLLRLGDPDCRPLLLQSPLVEHLKQLLQALDATLRHQRRLANQLIYTLKQYYPGALQAFPKCHSLIHLAFLEQYPTPQAAAALTEAEWLAFLQLHHYRYLNRAAQLLQALHQPAPAARLHTGYVYRVHTIIPLLRTLFHQRAALEKEIETLFRSHPEAAWWKSLPGIGPLTAARLLAYVGDNRLRFPSPGVLQAIAGTVPVTRRSGKVLHVEFRHACSHALRHAIETFARLSIRRSGWARAYFEAQIARGHSKPRAFRALANRWLSILWKLWQTNAPYDEAKHLANRARQGQPLPLPLS